MFKRLVAVLLLFSTFVITAPVSAADFGARKSLGSISGSGSVSLRGIPVSQEGTLFSGDQVAVGPNGSARVMLVNGGKIVLDHSTRLTFAQSGQLELTKGNAAFNSKNTSLDILAGNYNIKGDRTLSGNVAFVGSDYIGLRIATGTATVENLKTKQITRVSAGQERLFSLTTSDVKTPIAQLASNVPGPLPAVPPVPQTPTPPAKTGLTTSGWVAILTTIGGAAAAIAVLATTGKDSEDTASILARQKALQAAAVGASTATQASTAANQVANTATQVNAAVNASTASPAVKASLTTQGTAIASQATATQQQIANLNNQLTQLQAQLANVTDQATLASISTQINTVIASLNQQDAILNQQIAALNALIAAAQQAGVPNVPTITITPIPTIPGVASASIPA